MGHRSPATTVVYRASCMDDRSDLPAILVSDEERERSIVLLRDAVVSGGLTLEEFSDRVGRAQMARTDRELTELSVDLPAQPPMPVVITPAKHRAFCSSWFGAARGRSRSGRRGARCSARSCSTSARRGSRGRRSSSRSSTCSEPSPCWCRSGCRSTSREAHRSQSGDRATVPAAAARSAPVADSCVGPRRHVVRARARSRLTPAGPPWRGSVNSQAQLLRLAGLSAGTGPRCRRDVVSRTEEGARVCHRRSRRRPLSRRRWRSSRRTP